MDDVMAFAETFEGEDPTEEVGYVNMLSPGSSNFVTLDLTPGKDRSIPIWNFVMCRTHCLGDAQGLKWTTGSSAIVTSYCVMQGHI